MNILFFIAGLYLVADALVSIIVFYYQQRFCHLVRLGRFLIGVGLIIYAVL